MIMENFTPLSSTIGGVIIGLGAALMLFGLGRIAGISGIFGGLLVPKAGDVAWRLAFVLGLVLGGALMFQLAPDMFTIGIDRSLPIITIAGLLVGFGTRMGNGCTSGHGVCGISRLSPRSIVATVTFMVTGALTVFVAQHVLGGQS
jgi:uncharacterized membrane protein YedE/YeeE